MSDEYDELFTPACSGASAMRSPKLSRALNRRYRELAIAWRSVDLCEEVSKTQLDYFE